MRPCVPGGEPWGAWPEGARRQPGASRRGRTPRPAGPARRAGGAGRHRPARDPGPPGECGVSAAGSGVFLWRRRLGGGGQGPGAAGCGRRLGGTRPQLRGERGTSSVNPATGPLPSLPVYHSTMPSLWASLVDKLAFVFSVPGQSAD